MYFCHQNFKTSKCAYERNNLQKPQSWAQSLMRNLQNRAPSSPYYFVYIYTDKTKINTPDMFWGNLLQYFL